ncbi:unnamed protein product [Fusarium langsethiae]|nr:unnamed protein product [Fusarium langsethiae]
MTDPASQLLAAPPDIESAPLSRETDFQGFFEVTLGWGKLGFTAAKLIDVTWDLVIGRGGQAIMSLCAWRVFSEYLETSLATKPATYTTVWLLRFHRDSSVLSSLRLFFQFFRRGLASKLAMWIMFMTLLFMLAFPTIAGSMTGYTALNDLYITPSDDQLFPFESVKAVAVSTILPQSFHTRVTDERFHVTDVQQYGFNALGGETAGYRDNSTEFCGEIIHGPPLNISAYYLPGPFYWKSPSSKNGTIKTNPYDDVSKIMFVIDDDMYNSTELIQNGVCQPIKDKGSVQRYQWGFSFLQLYFVTILLLLWSLAMMILWKSSHDMLKLNHWETTSQDWKGLLEFTDTIRMQVEQAGINIDSLSDKQLDDKIQSVLQGGSV